MHWAADYIGIPWERGASGPHSYDCWNFFVHVQRWQFGRAIEDIGTTPNTMLGVAHAMEHSPERQNWLHVDRPQEGDAVLMARTRYPAHIGIWIKANGTQGVLHCMQGAGVVYSNPTTLSVAGWGGLSYYRHHPCTP